MSKPNKTLRKLPSVDAVLRHRQLVTLQEVLDPQFLARITREVLGKLRQELLDNISDSKTSEQLLAIAVERISKRVEFLTAPGLRKVLNATGIILHTGLGRAVFASKTRDRLMEIAQGYCNLEIDLESGKRGDRQERVAGLLSVLTGGEAACVVNNNAAAVMLVLNTLADRKEVIVSRGELIEIGGSFRLPEIIKKSGARLVEVGTTNKTRASDYAKAITPKTAALMKVHTSNYRIQGFTEDTGLAELSKIGRAHQLPVVHDLGGGILLELKNFGLPDEPVVEASIQAGANLITFSGDKIIGGPQAGLIVGDATLVQRVKRNPFMRALRCDKLTLSLLETALQLFLKPSEIQERHPVLRMLSEPIESVKQRALEMASKLREMRDFEIVVEKSTAEAGSGALPVEALPSYAVGIRSEKCSDIALAARLRRTEPPVIAYTRNRWLWLDVRTIHPLEIDKLVEVIATLQEAESG